MKCIYKLRRARKLTQEFLVAETGLSQSRISNIEHNIYDAKLSELKKIADAFNITIADLIDFHKLDKKTLLVIKTKVDKELE